MNLTAYTAREDYGNAIRTVLVKDGRIVAEKCVSVWPDTLVMNADNPGWIGREFAEVSASYPGEFLEVFPIASNPRAIARHQATLAKQYQAWRINKSAQEGEN